MDQDNYLYLKSFSTWLQNWDTFNSSSSYKKNKLSKETFSALLHTTNGLIKLCHYLKTDFNFIYILLGKFQTDKLEARFGQYRQMSGGNYNITVQQILESERKLKITSILILKSHKSGSLEIKNFNNECNSVDEILTSSDNDLILNCIDDVVSCSYDEEISEETIPIILYICGYVGKKIAERNKCNDCKQILLTSTDFHVEFAPNLIYLNNLNRGGLKYPSKFLILIGTIAYKIFQTLISEKFENLFLESSNQKQFLKAIILERVELENVDNVLCHCESNLQISIVRCVDIWCNILLNNYSKVKRDNICLQSGKKRKLSTLFTQ